MTSPAKPTIHLRDSMSQMTTNISPASDTLYADFHAHTTASDGTTEPEALVRQAREVGLTYLAVTDHDTTAAMPRALAAAREVGIRLMCGVEISAEGAPGKCHMLGLGIDPGHAEMNETLRALSESRRARNVQIIKRLRSLGVDITIEEVTAIAPAGANVGRPHFAQTLIAKGVVQTNQEAFDRYLADDAAAYVTRDSLTPTEAIRLVHDAGGLAFIAHPGLLRLSEQETYQTRFAALKAVGMDGIEAYYGAYSPALTEKLLRVAEKLELMVTGGSDFHGDNKPGVHLGIVRDGERLAAELLPVELLARAV